MKKLFVLVFIIIFIVAFFTNEKKTIIPLSMPDFIEKSLLEHCKDPKKADTWMVLSEYHNRWRVDAFVKCEIGNLEEQTLQYVEAISAGNTDLHRVK